MVVFSQKKSKALLEFAGPSKVSNALEAEKNSLVSLLEITLEQKK